MFTTSILLGGHVRTGLEVCLKYENGVDATNEMLVQRVVSIANAVGREIATVDEVRHIMNLI